MDRRTVIFLVFAGMCFVLIPAAEAKFRWVCEGVGATYVVLAVVSELDARSRAKR